MLCLFCNFQTFIPIESNFNAPVEVKRREINKQTTKQTNTSMAPSSSETLLPIRIISKVVKGFGRGSTELGIPTANLSSSPQDMKCQMSFDALPTGIYFGFARLASSADTCSTVNTTTRTDDTDATTTNNTTTTNTDTTNGANLPSLEGVYKAAVSIGYNPCYNNEHKTIEPHLIAPPGHPSRSKSACQETQFHELYNETMRLSIIGYLRPELPFEGLDNLIVAIKKDIVDTEESLSLSLHEEEDDGDNKDNPQHHVLVEAEKAWVLSNHGV